MCVTLQVHSNLYHPCIAQPPTNALPAIFHLFLALFLHLPHSPLAMMISPPLLGYHMISRDGGWKKLELLFDDGRVGRWVVHGRRWCEELSGWWWVSGSALVPNKPRHSNRKIPPRPQPPLTIYFKLYQSKPTRCRFVFMFIFNE